MQVVFELVGCCSWRLWWSKFGNTHGDHHSNNLKALSEQVWGWTSKGMIEQDWHSIWWWSSNRWLWEPTLGTQTWFSGYLTCNLENTSSCLCRWALWERCQVVVNSLRRYTRFRSNIQGSTCNHEIEGRTNTNWCMLYFVLSYNHGSES
jgi:hypothetical protein